MCLNECVYVCVFSNSRGSQSQMTTSAAAARAAAMSNYFATFMDPTIAATMMYSQLGAGAMPYGNAYSMGGGYGAGAYGAAAAYGAGTGAGAGGQPGQSTGMNAQPDASMYGGYDAVSGGAVGGSYPGNANNNTANYWNHQ